MLLEALGAGEPDLEELLDALEKLHVVGAIVLGIRHPPRRRLASRGRLHPKMQSGTQLCDSRLSPSSISVAARDR